MSDLTNPQVKAVFDSYGETIRELLLHVRLLILDVAKEDPDIGPLTETLKWGQPSYLPTKTRSGTTIRLGISSTEPKRPALFVHCQTSLVEEFRARFPNAFQYLGNRAIVFKANSFQREPLAWCIHRALTYHLRKA